MVAETDEQVGRESDIHACMHKTLMPRWRGPQAMGDEKRAMGYVCHRCHAEFMPLAARKMSELISALFAGAVAGIAGFVAALMLFE